MEEKNHKENGYEATQLPEEPWAARAVFTVGGLKITRGMLVILLAAAIMVGAIVASHPGGAATPDATTTASEESKQDKDKSDVNSEDDDADSFNPASLVGMGVYDAHDAAVNAGMEVRFISSGDAAKTDITDDIYNASTRLDGWDDWTVVDESDDGHTVTCTIDSKENLNAKAKSDENRKAGDDAAPAVMTACQREGGQRYPGGYDEHDILGVIQDVIRRDDGTYYYKVKATVNADTDVVVECVTTGDDNQQTIVSWDAN